MMKVAGILLSLAVLGAFAEDCVKDWGKCGGKNYDGPTKCCNNRYYCLYNDDYYSECVPQPVTPFPPAPPSKWCGSNGTTMDYSLLRDAGNVTPLEIAEIWAAATLNLTLGRHDGGPATCVEAVSTALGECGHPAQSPWMSIDDPVCNFQTSGPGGIWQVTSQDADDVTLAGCSDGYDCCCNARLAYAHAYNQGGATEIPSGYCAADNHDCNQIYSDCGGTTGDKWNDVEIDRSAKHDGAAIPDCNYDCNPWYPNCGTGYIETPSVDQEPCYWGPFSVAAGGVGKEFFPGFYGWGGYFQHYVESKAGACDNSPQCASLAASNCDTNPTYANYPNYYELARDACAAMLKGMKH